MLGLGTIQHVADKTMSIGGYTIPEGSVVSGVTRGLMYDPMVISILNHSSSLEFSHNTQSWQCRHFCVAL